MNIFQDKFIRIVVTIGTITITGMFLVSRLRQASLLTERQLINITKKVSAPALGTSGPFKVVTVYDGDTLKLDNGEKVRLLGIDAPEIHHKELPVQRFGEEAGNFLRKLVEGQECTLEYDPGNVRDKYNRLLAYVYVNGKNVNAELVSKGYAYIYTRFPFSKQEEFLELERQAAQAQYGLWNFSLRDGKLTDIALKYESLDMEGRRRFNAFLDELAKTRSQSRESDNAATDK